MISGKEKIQGKRLSSQFPPRLQPFPSRHHAIRPRRAEQLLLQDMQLVAHLRGLLELQVLGMAEHQFFQALDFLAHLFLAHGLVLGVFLRSLQFIARLLRAVDAVDQFADAVFDADWGDVVGGVEGDLLGAAGLMTGMGVRAADNVSKFNLSIRANDGAP